jgi:hypothetical protein
MSVQEKRELHSEQHVDLCNYSGKLNSNLAQRPNAE